MLRYSDNPGWTTAAEHCIDTADMQPVRIPSYHIPKAWEEQVKQEIRTLLDLGVLVRFYGHPYSNSECSHQGWPLLYATS